jgi:hypothetical protein
MDYTPKFDNNAKGKYNSDLGFVSIKSGSDAYLLEDEVNEIQWIQNEARANIIRNMTDSGCVQIDTFEHPTMYGGLIELGVDHLNSFGVKDFDAVINGYLCHIKPYDTDVNVIQLPPPPDIIGSHRYDFVYLEFWFKEINPNYDFTQKTDVYTYGGIDNTKVPFELVDLNITKKQVIEFNCNGHLGQPLWIQMVMQHNILKVSLIMLET